MKTIEERAEEFAERKSVYQPWQYKTSAYRSYKQLYIEIATEQRKIDEEEFHPIMEESVLKAINKQKELDIQKALSALFNCHCLPWDNIDAEELERDFRKAMEE